MKKTIYLIIALILVQLQCSQSQTIQERLGYSSNDRLLIIHADDLGVSHSENIASIQAMEEGSVTSASILVPCPWFSEIAKYAKENPEADLGLHLCITSEWDHYKWDPVLGASGAPSLVGKDGYFPSGREELPATMKAEEVGAEIEAQIERALAFGIKPTHLDAHMRALLTRPDFAMELIKAARKYNLPIATTPLVIQELLPNEDVSDIVFAQSKLTAGPDDYDAGMADFYEKTIRNLKPGLNELVIHTAFDDAEMQAATAPYVYWGSKWRQEDFDFFTSKRCKEILREEGIKLLTWREVKEKLMQ